MRLYDEEIKSAPEWERETLGGEKKKSPGHRDEEEFDFENSRATKDTADTNAKEDHHHAITSEQDVRYLEFIYLIGYENVCSSGFT